MTITELITAMQAGKKLCLPGWVKGLYVVCDGDEVTDEDGMDATERLVDLFASPATVTEYVEPKPLKVKGYVDYPVKLSKHHGYAQYEVHHGDRCVWLSGALSIDGFMGFVYENYGLRSEPVLFTDSGGSLVSLYYTEHWCIEVRPIAVRFRKEN